jgi:anti-anti-sigma factor
MPRPDGEHQMTSLPQEGFTLSVASFAGGVKLLALRGELDYGDASRVREALLAELAADGVRAFVVDLSDLEFIDSSGIQELVGAAKAAKARGTAFLVASPNANVARIFEIVRIGDVVDVEASVEAAVMRIDAA